MEHHIETPSNGFPTYSDFESLESEFSNSNSFSQNSCDVNGLGKGLFEFDSHEGNACTPPVKTSSASYGNTSSKEFSFIDHSSFSPEPSIPERNNKNDYGNSFHSSMQDILYDNRDSLDYIISGTDGNSGNIEHPKNLPLGFDVPEQNRIYQSPYRHPIPGDSTKGTFMNRYPSQCLDYDPLDASNVSMGLVTPFLKNDIYDFNAHGPCNVSQNGQSSSSTNMKVEHPNHCGEQFTARISMNTYTYPIGNGKNELMGYNFSEPPISTANENSSNHLRNESYGSSFSESSSSSQNYLANNFQNIYTNTFLNDPTCDFTGNDQPNTYQTLGEQEPLICGVCNKKFNCEASLRSHLSTHNGNQVFPPPDANSSKEKPFACDICGKRFKLEDGLNNHRMNHKSGTPDTCHICGKVYTQANRLEKHLLSHTTTSPYICDICGAAFRQQGLLKSHKLTHTGETSYPCNICGVAFSQEISLEKHSKTHEIIMEGSMMKKPYVCGVCGKRFKREAGLLKHRSSHKGDKPDKCHICGKIYTQANRLEKHLLKHASNRPYICDICGVGFQQPNLLNSHKQMHEREAAYVCNVCGKVFSQRMNLDQHMRLMHNDKNFNPIFHCSICDLRFTDRNSLEKHNLTHNGERINDSQDCERKYSSYERTHIIERPFRCDVCGNTFIEARHLSEHMRQHVPEKPCDKNFIQKYDLNEREMNHVMENSYSPKMEHGNQVREHGPVGRSCRCYVCGEEFGVEIELMRHFLTHTGGADYDSNMAFSENSHLQDHQV